MAQKDYSVTSTLGDETFNRLSRLYLLALVFIAISGITSQLVIQYYLQHQLGDGKVINLAGRQRMLSQKLAKEILLLANYPPSDNRKNSLKNTLDQWSFVHEALQNGSDSLGISGNNSPTVIALYKQIDPYFQSLSKQCQTILRQDTFVHLDQAAFIAEISTNEQNFLEGMDRLVFEYERESKSRVKRLRFTEFLLLALLLGVLVVELLFIFRPTAKGVKKIVQDLSDSEQQARLMAAENKTLFVEKERSLQELQTMNAALDNAALFASLTIEGRVVHISEKFKKLLGIHQIPPNSMFSEIVTTKEGAQQYLDELIHTPRSVIWTEEIQLTNRADKSIWLELSILPINQEGVQQDILLLCNDLTIRKEAGLEIERLNKERFELEIAQQKIRSVQVVEAQEEERKRIAKDMHDGIGQMLTALKFNLEGVNLNKPEKAKQKLVDIKSLAGDLIKSVRVATFNLTPPELTDYGIGTGLAKLVEGLTKRTAKNILFNNRTNFQGRFDSSTETNLYRITQEAINNSIKYAQANYTLVTLSHSDDLLSIVIDDDGVGFDVGAPFPKEDGSGMGLSFMEERVKFINGRLFVRSAIGEGTRITVNMPFTPAPNVHKKV